MALHYNEHKERLSLNSFYALLECSDPKHRYEYIEGCAYIYPHGTPDHSIIGANLTGMLRERLRKRPCFVYNSDVYIELADEANCLCPDASVSCDRRDYHAKKVIHYPSVIAQVLSPGTKARDRGIKFELYQNISTVQEILFIDTQVVRVQLYRRETDYWTLRSFTQEATLELTSLGIEFSVAEVYEKTTFDDTFMNI